MDFQIFAWNHMGKLWPTHWKNSSLTCFGGGMVASWRVLGHCHFPHDVLTLESGIVVPPLIGPAPRVLCNQLRPSVSLSVCLSVTKVLILPVISFLRFFASSYSLMSLKVTKPDFRKKNYLGQIWAKVGQILAIK